MKIRVKHTGNVKEVISRQGAELKRLWKKAFPVWVKHTPKKTGSARRKTKLVDKQDVDQIVADYPYAKPLDDGASKQSPDGMSKPTQEFVEKEFKRIFR